MIHGTTASVSTLLTTVGPPYSPTTAGNGGFRRRMAALAFERFEQRGLFAANVRARARVHIDVAVESGTEDVFAEEAALISLREGLLHNLQDVPVFAANVDVIVSRAQGVRRDDHSLDHLVRVVTHQVAVFARAGFRF